MSSTPSTPPARRGCARSRPHQPRHREDAVLARLHLRVGDARLVEGRFGTGDHLAPIAGVVVARGHDGHSDQHDECGHPNAQHSPSAQAACATAVTAGHPSCWLHACFSPRPTAAPRCGSPIRLLAESLRCKEAKRHAKVDNSLWVAASLPTVTARAESSGGEQAAGRLDDHPPGGDLDLFGGVLVRHLGGQAVGDHAGDAPGPQALGGAHGEQRGRLHLVVERPIDRHASRLPSKRSTTRPEKVS